MAEIAGLALGIPPILVGILKSVCVVRDLTRRYKSFDEDLSHILRSVSGDSTLIENYTKGLLVDLKLDSEDITKIFEQKLWIADDQYPQTQCDEAVTEQDYSHEILDCIEGTRRIMKKIQAIVASCLDESEQIVRQKSKKKKPTSTQRSIFKVGVSTT